MKRIALVLLVCCVPLASCQQADTPIVNGSSVADTSPEVFANAQKGLTVAHLAYNAIGSQILQATSSGLLKGNAAAQVKVVYDKAGDALNIADTAERAGNTTNLLHAIQEANSAISQAKSLLGAN